MADNRAPMITKLDQTYAAALWQLAQEAGEGTAADVVGQMRQIGALAQRQPDLVRLVSTRILSTQQRSQIIEQVFKGRVDDLVHRFLQILNRKNRLDHLAGIVVAFARLVDEQRGVVDVNAYVAQRLDDDVAQRVADGIGRSIDKQVQLHQHVDGSLIGGLKLRIGDKLIDGSVASQLRIIGQQIVAAGREKARQQAG